MAEDVSKAPGRVVETNAAADLATATASSSSTSTTAPVSRQNRTTPSFSSSASHPAAKPIARAPVEKLIRTAAARESDGQEPTASDQHDDAARDVSSSQSPAPSTRPLHVTAAPAPAQSAAPGLTPLAAMAAEAAKAAAAATTNGGLTASVGDSLTFGAKTAGATVKGGGLITGLPKTATSRPPSAVGAKKGAKQHTAAADRTSSSSAWALSPAAARKTPSPNPTSKSLSLTVSPSYSKSTPLTVGKSPPRTQHSQASLELALARLTAALDQTRYLRSMFTSEIYEKYRLVLYPVEDSVEEIVQRVKSDPEVRLRTLREESRRVIEEREMEKREGDRLNAAMAGAQAAAGAGAKSSNTETAEQLAWFGAGLNTVILPEQDVGNLLAGYTDRGPIQPDTGGCVEGVTPASASAAMALLDRVRRGVVLRKERKRRRSSGADGNNGVVMPPLPTSIYLFPTGGGRPGGANVSSRGAAAGRGRKGGKGGHIASTDSSHKIGRLKGQQSGPGLLSMNPNAEEVTGDTCRKSASTAALLSAGVGDNAWVRGTPRQSLNVKKWKHPFPDSKAGEQMTIVYKSVQSSKKIPGSVASTIASIASDPKTIYPPLDAKARNAVKPALTKRRSFISKIAAVKATSSVLDRISKNEAMVASAKDTSVKMPNPMTEIDFLFDCSKSVPADEKSDASIAFPSARYADSTAAFSVLHALGLFGGTKSTRSDAVRGKRKFTEAFSDFEKEFYDDRAVQSIRGGGTSDMDSKRERKFEEDNGGEEKKEKTEFDSSKEVGTSGNLSLGKSATLAPSSCIKPAISSQPILSPQRKLIPTLATTPSPVFSPQQLLQMQQQVAAAGMVPGMLPQMQSANLDSTFPPMPQFAPGFQSSSPGGFQMATDWQIMQKAGLLRSQQIGLSPPSMANLSAQERNARETLLRENAAMVAVRARAQAVAAQQQAVSVAARGMPGMAVPVLSPQQAVFVNVAAVAGASGTHGKKSYTNSSSLGSPLVGSVPRQGNGAPPSPAKLGASELFTKTVDTSNAEIRSKEVDEGKRREDEPVESSKNGKESASSFDENVAAPSNEAGSEVSGGKNSTKGLSKEAMKMVKEVSFHEALRLNSREKRADRGRRSNEDKDHSCDFSLLDYTLQVASEASIPKQPILNLLKQRTYFLLSIVRPGIGANRPRFSEEAVTAVIVNWLCSRHKVIIDKVSGKEDILDTNSDAKWLIYAAVDVAARALVTARPPQHTSSLMPSIVDVHNAKIVSERLAQEIHLNKALDCALVDIEQMAKDLDEKRIEALKVKAQERTLLAALVARKGRMSENFSHSFVSSLVRAGEALGHEEIFDFAQDEPAQASTMLPYDFFAEDVLGTWEDPCRPPGGFTSGLTGEEWVNRAHAQAMIRKSLKKLQDRYGIKGGAPNAGPYVDRAGSKDVASSSGSGGGTRSSPPSRQPSGLKRKASFSASSSDGGFGLSSSGHTMFNASHYSAPLNWDADLVENKPYGKRSSSGSAAASGGCSGGRQRSASKGRRSPSPSSLRINPSPEDDAHSARRDRRALLGGGEGARTTFEIEWAGVASMFVAVDSTERKPSGSPRAGASAASYPGTPAAASPRACLPAMAGASATGADKGGGAGPIIAPMIRDFDYSILDEDGGGGSSDEGGPSEEEDLSDEAVLRRHQEVLDDMKENLEFAMKLRKEIEEKQSRGRRGSGRRLPSA